MEQNWTATHTAAMEAIISNESISFPILGGIDATNEQGWCLLHFAAALGKRHAVKMLLDAGANPDLRATDGGLTPLLMAIVKQHTETVDILIEGGANPNLGGNIATLLVTALSLSPINEHIVGALIEAGADVNRTPSDRRSPLHLAAGKGMLDAARGMIARGANINAKDDQGRTPYDVDRKSTRLNSSHT